MESTGLSLGITIIAIAVGIILLVMVGLSMKKKQISDYQGIVWIITALLIIIFGAFPGILGFLADILGVWWAPAILLFADAVLIGFICFIHSKEISLLKAQVTELSEQISILRAERQEELSQDEGFSGEHSDLREEHSIQ